MKVHYQNTMANFIITRAFILLLISIFLFPLIIFLTPSTTQQDLLLPCAQELDSYFSQSSLLPDTAATKSKPQIPPAKTIHLQTVTLSFFAWWTCPPRIPLEGLRKL